MCLNKLEGGFPDDEDGLLSVGQVDAARRPARPGGACGCASGPTTTDSGDRDELVPGVSERAWRQVSVSAHECMGGKCPLVAECFVERAREAAKDVDVIVTNHSFMAIDSFEGRQMLPEHDVLVVDEAHELVDRVTSTITDELTGAMVMTAAKQGRAACPRTAAAIDEAGELLAPALEPLAEGRMTRHPRLASASPSRGCATPPARCRASSSRSRAGGRRRPAGGPGRGRRGATRTPSASSRSASSTSCGSTATSAAGPVLRVAPMSVAMLVRDKVFEERTVVLTSATLELGGTFDAVAGTIGLRGEGAPHVAGPRRRQPVRLPRSRPSPTSPRTCRRPAATAPATRPSTRSRRWCAPPAAARWGSSRRCAPRRRPPRSMRARASATTSRSCARARTRSPRSVRQFARDPRTCLFGTLTLWQGVDVPGSSCQLVIIDRIPFPRPDDPLASARSQAIARMGGNGFMAVSATHAALRLAQGAGRLVRRADDRGVVAFLDSRMMTARYAGFLQRSLPPFYPTTDKQMVLAALARLDAMAPPPVAVEEPALRSLTGARADADGTEHPRPVAVPPPAPVSSRSAVTSGHAWTDEQDEELRDAADAGMQLDELVDHFELPEETIAARVEQLGLTIASGALFD